jgi:prepilin-type N-terminal cleavage/methylation domain-containing protein
MMKRRTMKIRCFKRTEIFSFTKGREDGFTLVELMIVMAIASIIIGIGIWAGTDLLPDYRLKGAASRVRTDLYQARVSAAKVRRQYQVEFSTNGYEVKEGDSTSGSTSWTTTLSRNFSDYPNVTVKSVTNNPRFSPRGTADVMGTITLQNDKGTEREIAVSRSKIKVN